METFSSRLRKARLSKGYTPDILARILRDKHVNIQTETIRAYENGNEIPSHDIIVKLGNQLNVSVDFLIGNEDSSSIVKTMDGNKLRNVLSDRDNVALSLPHKEQQTITNCNSFEEREQKLTKWILSRDYLFNNIDDKELDKVLKAIDTLLRR